jgi:hypothetical protein
MINYSTKYQQNNKTNTHLSQITEDKKPQHMTLGIQVLAWDRPKYMAELNRLMGCQTFLLDNMISNDNTYINKRYKNRHISLHSKRPYTSTKMNDNINMDSTIAGWTNDNINMDSTIAGWTNDNINMDSTIAGW